MIKIIELPFEKRALEPVLSEHAVTLHYEKHHQVYVDTTNKLIKDTIYKDESLEHIVKHSKGPIFNNAAQVWNHNFYWNCLTPQSDMWEESGEIRAKIEEQFESLETFQEQFINVAARLFGSGWCWLIEDSETHALKIKQYSNADTPLTEDNIVPLLIIDVWEHAWAYQYENDKKRYLTEIWKIVNWDFVRRQYTRH